MHRTTRNGIALVALVGTFATSLWAYSLIGPIWSGTTTPYWINTSNRDGLSDSALETAVRSGADVWNSTNQNTYFDATYAGPTSRSTVTLNNYNDVFFRNGRSGNAIATTYTWYIGSEIVEADIAFWDKKWRFFTGTSDCSGGFYVEDIITHEMGHFYGLGHSGDVNATMYPSASYCSQEFRSLDSDDVDGIEATRAIRAEPRNAGLAIVALTAAAMAEDRQRCIDAGMDDFLAKPFEVPELRRVIDTWCAK